MPQVDVYTEPGPIPDGVQLRVYSSAICPYAQVCTVLDKLYL